jgi:hypothetical protein
VSVFPFQLKREIKFKDKKNVLRALRAFVQIKDLPGKLVVKKPQTYRKIGLNLPQQEAGLPSQHLAGVLPTTVELPCCLSRTGRRNSCGPLLLHLCSGLE